MALIAPVSSQKVVETPFEQGVIMVIALAYVQKGDKETAKTYLPKLKELDENLARILEEALAK